MTNPEKRIKIENNLGGSPFSPKASSFDHGDISNIGKQEVTLSKEGGDGGDECEEVIEEIGEKRKALEDALNALKKIRKKRKKIEERIKNPNFENDVQGIEKKQPLIKELRDEIIEEIRKVEKITYMTERILSQLIDKLEQIIKEIFECQEIIENPPYDVDVNNIRDVKNPKNIEKINKNQLIEEQDFIANEIRELIKYVSGHLENELNSRKETEGKFWKYVNRTINFYEAVDEYCYSISDTKESKKDSGKEFNDEIDKKSEKGGGSSGKYFNN